MYDLVKDPLEKISIINELPKSTLKQFRLDLKTMYLSQFALENDQVILR